LPMHGLLVAILVALIIVMVAEEGLPQDTKWVEAWQLTLEGKGWTDTESPYDRFPARAKGVVPDGPWYLSKHSAGLAVRFITDASWIACRWKLISSHLAMEHMPATGVSGVDLYMRLAPDQQKPPGQAWHWIGVGRPRQQEMEARIAGGIPAGEHEFILYFPLYNGVTSLQIGVPADAKIVPAPERGKPIVFWGSSITQGGCAARPGMAYPAILGRWLDVPTINLGFSGNGKMDPPITKLLTELDVAAYVIDCCPNMPPQMIEERTEPLVRELRAAHPDVPILLVENIEYQASAALPGAKKAYLSKNEKLRAAYERLVQAGVNGLIYVPGEQLLGNDGEATVDGTHPTDLGFMRMAQALRPILAEALGQQ